MERHSHRTLIDLVFCNWRQGDKNKKGQGLVNQKRMTIECPLPSAGVLVIVVVWQGVSFGAMLADIWTGGAGTHQHAGSASSGAFYAPESCRGGQRWTLFPNGSKESCALLLLGRKAMRG